MDGKEGGRMVVDMTGAVMSASLIGVMIGRGDMVERGMGRREGHEVVMTDARL